MKAFSKLLALGIDRKTDEQTSVLEYEARFNIATCLFKLDDCLKAHYKFTELMNDQKRAQNKNTAKQKEKIPTEAYVLRFKGKDRRLYYNKAVCELRMGQFEQTKKTCEAFLNPVKRVLKKLVVVEE